MIDQGNNNVYENESKFVYETNQTVTVGSGAFPFPMYVPPADYMSRKRSRDSYSFDPSELSFSDDQFVNQIQPNNCKGIYTFLGDDLSMQIYQQQSEIDRFIAQYTEKMRSEIEANRRITSMRLISAADAGVKRLKSKQDEIVQIGRLNRVLEEKVRSLTVDNQIWQQMAQTNEATANVLRRNLQQILTQVQQQKEEQQQDQDRKLTGAIVDDGESCCGSNYALNYGSGDGQQRMLAKVDTVNEGNDVDAYCETSGDKNGSRWCRNCGKEEFGVLLLPCRHLCICTVCESSINVCPVCKCLKNASLHVNMNSF